MLGVASGSGNPVNAGSGLGVPSHIMAAPEMLPRPSEISRDTGYTSTPVSTRPNSQRTIPRQDSHPSNNRTTQDSHPSNNRTTPAGGGGSIMSTQSKSGSLGNRSKKTKNVTGKLQYQLSICT